MNLISKTLEKLIGRIPPTVLYHYTTGSGFLGIVKSKEIWATSIHYLNDTSEFVLASEISKKIIKEVRSKLAGEIDFFARTKDAIEAFGNENICVSSFSAQKDQLSQWRAYAGNSGFSIGFNTKRISEIARNARCLLAPCIYDDKVQTNIIREVVDFYLEEFRQELREGTNNFDEICLMKSRACAVEIITIAPMLKHSSFREEQEWRLITNPIESNNSNLDYRAGKSMLLPYYRLKLCLPKKPLDIIKELYVGPTPHPRHARAAATSALSKYEYTGWSPYSSSTPYRNW